MNGEGRAGDFDLDRLITISMDLVWFNLKQEFLVNLCFVTHTHTHTHTNTHTHTTNGLTGFYTTLEAPCLHELTGFYAMPEAQQVTHTHTPTKGQASVHHEQADPPAIPPM